MAKIKKHPIKFRKKTPEKVVFKAKASAKKEKITKELPKNSRFITERAVLFSFSRLKKIILPVIYLALFALLVFVAADVYQESRQYFALTSQTEDIKQEIGSLEKKVQIYPSFKEGYLRLAILEYRLGDIDKSKKYIRKAVLLDPNFKQAQDFAKLIGERL